MQSEFLLVTFKDNRAVKAKRRACRRHQSHDDPAAGRLCHRLGGRRIRPPSQDIELISTSHVRPMVVAFT